MHIIYTTNQAIKLLEQIRREGKSQIGFVPTMGALHKGHLALIERAKMENDFVVSSIFVNPLQFNNSSDLINYPRTFDHDVELLKSYQCDMLFCPTVNEIYPEPQSKVYDFGHLDTVMEGRYRPGHFNGVAIVVKRLFDIINPQKGYFGEKDYQQLAIIRKLVQLEQSGVEIVACSTIREVDGLAMSSRNARLSPDQRAKASLIYQILQQAKVLTKSHSVSEIKKFVVEKFDSEPIAKLEYFELSDAETLLPITDLHTRRKIVASVAAYFGDVRLIDNVIIFP